MLRSPASICRSRPNVLLVTSLRDGIAGGSASVDCAVAGLILTNGATAMVLAVAPTKWRRVNSIFLRIPICSISICSHFNDSPLASGPDRRAILHVVIGVFERGAHDARAITFRPFERQVLQLDRKSTRLNP